MIDLTKLVKPTHAPGELDSPAPSRGGGGRKRGNGSGGRSHSHKQSTMGWVSCGMALTAALLSLIAVPAKSAQGFAAAAIFIVLLCCVTSLVIIGVVSAVVGITSKRRGTLLASAGLLLNPAVGAAFAIYLWWPVGANLVIAAENGMVEEVQRAIAMGVNVNEVVDLVDNRNESFKGTALIGASMNGHVEVVKLLIDEQAEVNLPDNLGRTALFHAVTQGHAEVAATLLDNGADPNLNPPGATLLYNAAKLGKELIVHRLLRHGAKVISQDYPPLIVAAEAGHSKIVELLLDYRADVNATDADGNTALHLAASQGHVYAVKKLLAKQANPSLTNRFRETPLEMALGNGHKTVSEDLLNAGTPVDVFSAIALGDTTRVKKELERDATLVTQTKRELTPLHLAAREGNLEIVRVLLEKGAPVNARSRPDGGETPLYLATRNGRTEVLGALLEAKADANLMVAVQGAKAPALYFAVVGGHVKIVELLLAAGADVNVLCEVKGVEGTPLLFAAGQRQLAIARMLIDAKADVNFRKNINTPTALIDAARNGDSDMVLLLINAKADVNVRLGTTPLITLVEQKQRGNEKAEIYDVIFNHLNAAGARD